MKQNKGITLLLVIVILSALLSLSIGIFNVVFGEFLISGEITDSYLAFYAADSAIDKYLYVDRNTANNDNASEDTTTSPSSKGCFVVKLYKKTIDPVLFQNQCGAAPSNNCIISVGQSQCGTNSARLVKRGFMVLY